MPGRTCEHHFAVHDLCPPQHRFLQATEGVEKRPQLLSMQMLVPLTKVTRTQAASLRSHLLQGIPFCNQGVQSVDALQDLSLQPDDLFDLGFVAPIVLLLVWHTQ